MECTLGNLENSWFAEFQIAFGAISNLQNRAHLREGTPATLNQRVQGTPVQFSGVCLHFSVTFLVWRAGCTPALFLLEFFCDRIYPRVVFSRHARRVSQRSAPGASDRSGDGDAEVCVGMLLHPVVIPQVFVSSIR